MTESGVDEHDTVLIQVVVALPDAFLVQLPLREQAVLDLLMPVPAHLLGRIPEKLKDRFTQ